MFRLTYSKKENSLVFTAKFPLSTFSRFRYPGEVIAEIAKILNEIDYDSINITEDAKKAINGLVKGNWHWLL